MTAASVEDRVAFMSVRKIAGLTGELGPDAALRVDAEIADRLDLPTGRLLSVVEGRVVAADPAVADARAEHRRSTSPIEARLDAIYRGYALTARGPAPPPRGSAS